MSWQNRIEAALVSVGAMRPELRGLPARKEALDALVQSFADLISVSLLPEGDVQRLPLMRREIGEAVVALARMSRLAESDLENDAEMGINKIERYARERDNNRQIRGERRQAAPTLGELGGTYNPVQDAITYGGLPDD
jgi:hypothetical protein